MFRFHGLAKISSSGIDGTCFEIEDIQTIQMQINREKVTEVNRELNRFTWKRCCIFWTVETLFSANVEAMLGPLETMLRIYDAT